MRVYQQRDRILPYLAQRLQQQQSHFRRDIETQTQNEDRKKQENELEQENQRSKTNRNRDRDTLVYHCINQRQGAGEALALEAAVEKLKKTERNKKSNLSLKRLEIVGHSVNRFSSAVFALLQYIPSITDLSISTPTVHLNMPDPKNHYGTRVINDKQDNQRGQTRRKMYIWKREREMRMARHPLRSAHAIELLCTLLWPSKLNKKNREADGSTTSIAQVNLARLELRGCLGAPACVELAYALRINATLTEVDLSDNPWLGLNRQENSSENRAVTALSNFMRLNRVVRTLSLSNCGFTQTAAESLGKGIAENEGDQISIFSPY